MCCAVRSTLASTSMTSMEGWAKVDTVMAQWNATAAFFVSDGQWQARRFSASKLFWLT